jgi:hypothetical protein
MPVSCVLRPARAGLLAVVVRLGVGGMRVTLYPLGTVGYVYRLVMAGMKRRQRWQQRRRRP